MTKPSVLIVGGGIAGLALAALLQKNNFKPVLIEKTTKWKTIGFILSIFPNGMKMLDLCGVGPAIRSVSTRLNGWVFYDDQGKTVWESTFRRIENEFGMVMEVERDLLHKKLRHAAKGVEIKMSTTVKSLDAQTDKVMVVLSDGSKITVDLVIGADGLDSQVRRYVQKGKSKSYTGYTFWIFWSKLTRGIFPNKIASYFAKNRAVGIFPSKNRNHAAVALTLKAKAHEADTIDDVSGFLKSEFSDIGGLVPAILETLPRECFIFHHDDEEIKTDHWCSKRIVLIGDAAHAISPFMAMGASMALEDAAVLASKLATEDHIEAALRSFTRERLDRVNSLLKWSRRMHQVLSLHSPSNKLRNKIANIVIDKKYFKFLIEFIRNTPDPNF